MRASVSNASRSCASCSRARPTAPSADAASPAAEWAPDELYLPLPRPGGDAWLRVDLGSGAAEYEITDRGWISYLNDLHKGRHTGLAWSWFIDLFALAASLSIALGLMTWAVLFVARRFGAAASTGAAA